MKRFDNGILVAGAVFLFSALSAVFASQQLPNVGTAVTLGSPALFGDGTALAPSITFASDTNTGIYRPASDTFRLVAGGGTVANVSLTSFQVLRSLSVRSPVASGTTEVKTAACTEAALSGATVTATDCIPAGSFVFGVTVFVDTLIEGATTFTIGDADPDRWGTGIAVAQGTTTDITDFTADGFGQFTSATDVVLTGTGGSFTAGAVTITVHYISLTAGT